MIDFIKPDWPAPLHVRAVSTTRTGGVSAPPRDSFNLAAHVDDAPDAVASNRHRLREALGLVTEPFWLDQVHSAFTVEAGGVHNRADASWSGAAGNVCAVLTADCLPLLFCDRQGTRVAACHAGWRGLAAGVIPATVNCFDGADDLMVWLGPAIGPRAFQVGDEVIEAFTSLEAELAVAFNRQDEHHWLCDIYRLASLMLRACGVTSVYGGGLCTVKDPARFFSYRRDGATGRMASLIWLDPAQQ